MKLYKIIEKIFLETNIENDKQMIFCKGTK